MKQAMISLIIFAVLFSFSGCKKKSDTLSDSKLSDDFSYSEADDINASDDFDTTNSNESGLESNSDYSYSNDASSIDSSSKNNNATDSMGKVTLPSLPATININSYRPQITVTKLSFSQGTVYYEATVDEDSDFDPEFYIQLLDEEGFVVDTVLCCSGPIPSGGKFKGEEKFTEYKNGENYTLLLKDRDYRD